MFLIRNNTTLNVAGNFHCSIGLLCRYQLPVLVPTTRDNISWSRCVEQRSYNDPLIWKLHKYITKRLVVSNSSDSSKGHHGKSFRCNICWAYREKFGPECQLNFLLSSACCRNLVAEGRRERYCFLYSFMTPGILYQRNRTALGRFVGLRSVWEVLGAAAMLPAWSHVESEQGGKPS